MELSTLRPFGIEISGIDSNDLGNPDVRTLPNLLAEHHVVVVRDQLLDSAAQVRLTGLIGPVLDERATGANHTFVSNVRPGAVAPNGELVWHQDAPFLKHPFAAILLYAVEVEAGAAPTYFANNADAYDALPVAMRARAESLRASHVFSTGMRSSYTGLQGTAQSAEPQTVHEVVKCAAITKRRYLFVTELMTREILDIDADSSTSLLDSLKRVIYDPRNRLEHHWRNGDLVIWDNLIVQHRRPSGREDCVRDLRRTVVGDQTTATEYAHFRAWLYGRSGSDVRTAQLKDD